MSASAEFTWGRPPTMTRRPILSNAALTLMECFQTIFNAARRPCEQIAAALPGGVAAAGVAR
jgi:hypothetical protein